MVKFIFPANYCAIVHFTDDFFGGDAYFISGHPDIVGGEGMLGEHYGDCFQSEQILEVSDVVTAFMQVMSQLHPNRRYEVYLGRFCKSTDLSNSSTSWVIPVSALSEHNPRPVEFKSILVPYHLFHVHEFFHSHQTHFGE